MRRARGGRLAPARYPLVLAGVTAAALFLAACSSGSSTSCGHASINRRLSLAHRTRRPARPVSVGIIVDGGSGAIGTAPLVEQGAKMAVAYANAYRDGIRPPCKIKLVTCQNQSTPAGGQDCANQMVQDKVVAVTVPFTGQGPTEVPTIIKAGIPTSPCPAHPTGATTPGAYALTGEIPGRPWPPTRRAQGARHSKSSPCW